MGIIIGVAAIVINRCAGGAVRSEGAPAAVMIGDCFDYEKGGKHGEKNSAEKQKVFLPPVMTEKRKTGFTAGGGICRLAAIAECSSFKAYGGVLLYK